MGDRCLSSAGTGKNCALYEGAKSRAALKGTNLRGQTPICGFLRVPAVFCSFLRKSAKICVWARFVPSGCPLKRALKIPAQYWIKIMHPWVQKVYPVLGLGSGRRLLWHFQTPVLYWINISLRFNARQRHEL